MKEVRCRYCGFTCYKYGKTRAGTQRWKCRECGNVFTLPINRDAKDFSMFLDWLFSKDTQKDMTGEGRNFRRKTAKFWDIWAIPPKIEEPRETVYVDGIYLARKACILIRCDEHHVLGWYLCRYERAFAWEALMSRIAEPRIVVSDGGPGFQKALKKVWPNARLQRCIFHVFCQVRRYTTTRPRTLAGAQLYMLARDLLEIKTLKKAEKWVSRFESWTMKHKEFLKEMTMDDRGVMRHTHERLIKAKTSLISLIKSGNLFTYLKEADEFPSPYPATNNLIEGGVNAQLRAMLRNHRGLSVERRIKAVFWWCYMHSPKPLSLSEILKVMPTDKSISTIYNSISSQQRLADSIPAWGDAIMWDELHNSGFNPSHDWD